MDLNLDKISQAQMLMDLMSNPNISVKRVKREKGLIERVEGPKVILTEDNRQVLND